MLTLRIVDSITELGSQDLACLAVSSTHGGLHCSYMSARIGEANSTFADGIISHANALALALGAEPGKSCQQVMDKLRASRAL